MPSNVCKNASPPPHNYLFPLTLLPPVATSGVTTNNIDVTSGPSGTTQPASVVVFDIYAASYAATSAISLKSIVSSAVTTGLMDDYLLTTFGIRFNATLLNSTAGIKFGLHFRLESDVAAESVKYYSNSDGMWAVLEFPIHTSEVNLRIATSLISDVSANRLIFPAYSNHLFLPTGHGHYCSQS